MNNSLLVGAGAGLVSALLIAVVVKNTPLAILLYLLAPIPILIVSLGWNHRAGLVAAAVGAVAIAVAFSRYSALGFVIGTALPAWWLAYLALLGRPRPDGGMEWYPIGRLLGWIALTATLTLVAAAFLSTGGDYARFHENAREVAREVLRVSLAQRAGTDPDAAGRDAFVDGVATLVPAFAAQGFTVVLAFYVWAAAKAVQLSGRLIRPWPFLPATAMPRFMLGAFALAALLGLLPGFIRVFGMALCGALVAAFALQGLAAIHDWSRGRSGRLGILIGTYLLLLISQGALLLPLLLLGLADSALGRGRRPPPPGGSGGHT